MRNIEFYEEKVSEDDNLVEDLVDDLEIADLDKEKFEIHDESLSMEVSSLYEQSIQHL